MASVLDTLSHKINQAAHELASLRKDRDRLTAELELMRGENRRARKVLREHGELVVERKRVQEILARIIDKLNQARI